MFINKKNEISFCGFCRFRELQSEHKIKRKYKQRCGSCQRAEKDEEYLIDNAMSCILERSHIGHEETRETKQEQE